MLNLTQLNNGFIITYRDITFFLIRLYSFYIILQNLLHMFLNKLLICIQAVMANGLTILFDGNNRVAVMVDERHLNATCGLCGTYNNNQRDDFYTEAGNTPRVKTR